MTDSDFETSRRHFLHSIALAAGAAAAPWALGAAHAADTAGARVRIGIIGVGDRGSALLQNLNQSRNCVVTAVCDDYPPNLARARALAGPRAAAHADYRRLLQAGGLDAAVVATPLDLHAPVVLDALDAGLHVFCEKAMARTVEDCTAMVERSRQHGRVLQIGHQRMFSPAYLRARARILAGDIGVVTQIRAQWHRNSNWRRSVPPGSGLERKINWRLYKQHSGGLMTELACHQLQVANWFFDAVPTRVIGSGSLCYWKDGRDIDDQVALIYDYSGGRKLIYDSLINNRRYGCEEQVQGDKGTIEAETAQMFTETTPTVPGLQRMLRDIAEGLYRSVPIGGASWSPEIPVTTPGESLGRGPYEETLLQLEAFGEAVKTGRPLPDLLRQAYHASIASLLGERAMDTGLPVEWPDHLRMPKEAA
ncbi:Gfo/Idh/MocA family protein [Luteimonas salinilitoris]|uniref:Gfo/Idh/MocA family protein n=1 Tax=Luteimonas salinilitoris TaxID=3237697 RepID=A0ABV4HV06_9GAMM